MIYIYMYLYYRDDIYVFGHEEDYSKALRHGAYCKFPSFSQVYTGFRPDMLA